MVTPLVSVVEISTAEALERTQLTPPQRHPCTRLYQATSATITMCLVAPLVEKSRSCSTARLKVHLLASHLKFELFGLLRKPQEDT